MSGTVPKGPTLRSGARTAEVALWVLSVGLALAALWPILAVDKGIDAGDEALYVLVAGAPTPEYFWTNPWGWITRPLWAMSGDRLDVFRWLGAALLGIGFIAATASVLTAAGSMRPGLGPSPVLIRWMSLAGGLAASLLYYSGFLRAPGYNWVNLMGMSLVVASGAMWLTRETVPAGKWRAFAIPLVLALGLVVSGIGKPTTPIFELSVIAVLGVLRHDGRTEAALLLRTISLGVLIVLGMWAAGWLGRNPFATLAVVLSQPQLGSEQTVLGGFLISATVPLHLILWMGQFWYYALLVGSVFVAALLFRRNRAPRWLAPALFIAVAVTSVLIWIGILPAATRGHNYQLRPEAVLATIGLLAASLAVALNAPTPSISVSQPRLAVLRLAWWKRPRVVIVVFLCVQPSIYCFGTSNGPFQGMTWALGFWFLAAAFIAVTSPTTGSKASAAMVTAALVASAAWCMVEGRQYAYGMKPVADQTELVSLGQPAFSIFVDPDTRQSISQWQEAALKAHLPAGRPVAAVTAQWSTLPPLALGSSPPPSLMVTLFGSPYSARIAEFNTARPPLEFDWDTAWFAVQGSQLSGDQPFPVAEVASIVAARGGRAFPQDYVLASRVGDFELWRPSR